VNTVLETMETIPTRGYLGAALAAIALSAALRLFGKKDAAVFVGQWPPTFILFALAYKLLRPSDGDFLDEGQEAARRASSIITPSI
jgi:hypothetical protein